ncbi:MAG: hypothetical protein R3284_09920 [Rubricoccaceae bacterium]|nr:hypothetical protein [Rubricoccaceae bacterium]
MLSRTTLLAIEPLHTGTGLEWMTIASFIAPLVLLVLLIWLGSRNTV